MSTRNSSSKLSHLKPRPSAFTRSRKPFVSVKNIAAALLIGAAAALAVVADETCSSPYLTRIEGQEEFLYVWTLGVDGLGDGSGWEGNCTS